VTLTSDRLVDVEVTMTSTAPFVVHRGTDDRKPWHVLAGADRTGGLVTFGEARMPARTGGPSRHVHVHEDEAIYVVSGELTVEVGPDRHRVSSGMLAWLPRGVPHTFANLSDEPVWAVGVITPGGFERMFAEQDEYLAGLTGPPVHEVLMEISAKYGVTAVDGAPLL
jgi:mannose-6-phosphate isomerase-like protein (cupin superfamily)